MSSSPGAGGSNARKSTSLDGQKHRRTEGRQHSNTDLTRRLSKLYDALCAARASDLKVRKAAEEAAAYGQRFHPLERQLEDVTGKRRLQR
jgi:hypothetical protein